MEEPEKKKTQCHNCIGVGVIFSSNDPEEGNDGVEEVCSVCNGEGEVYNYDGDDYLIDNRTDEFLPED